MIFGCCEDKETSRKLVRKLGLKFPYAYGLDVEEHSKALGCYYEPKDMYLHATGFVLDDDKKINISAYSSGVLGRIRADNALSVIRYYQTEETKYLPQI